MPKDGKYYQGRFNPQNPSKYKGDKKNIIYRSSWELLFLRWCDRNDNVISYASEEFFIPYYDVTTRKVRRYFPDFLIAIREQSGEIKKYLIEVKPLKHTKAPVRGKKKERTYLTESIQYAKNVAKWEAAKKWCKSHGLEFRIITEKELGLNK